MSVDPELTPRKRLILLGGGAAHLELLREWAASPMPDVRVTLVVPLRYHVHLPLLPAWVAGQCELQDIAVPLDPWARRAGVELVQADLQAIDPVQRTLRLAGGTQLPYDALSIDAEAVAHRESIPGARAHALFARPVLHFIHLWDAVVRLSEQQILNLVVVGGDVPAIELAIAIQHGLRRRARVALVTGGGPPLGRQPEAFQQRVKQVLKRSQVTLFEDRCDAISGRQMHLGNGMRLACDAPVVADPPSSPLWLFDSGLSLDPDGFLLTGPTLQSVSHPAVFGSGELTVRDGWIPRDAGSYGLRSPMPTPQLGRNLRRFLSGDGDLESDERGQAVSFPVLEFGNRRAIARLGRTVVEGRWVGWLKRRVDQRVMERFGLDLPTSDRDGSGMAATTPGEGIVPD